MNMKAKKPSNQLLLSRTTFQSSVPTLRSDGLPLQMELKGNNVFPLLFEWQKKRKYRSKKTGNGKT